MGHKLIIANRGEIACRIIRAAGRLGIPTVAIYSDADEGAPHTMLADEAYCVGPGPAAQSYLNQGQVLHVASACGATLLHPGYGFLAENANFARQCVAAGVTFVGPEPHVIDAMGDKDQARQLATEAGVPVAKGSAKLSDAAAPCIDAGRKVGYPLLVKASAGGGGIGMRLVERESELLKAIEETRSLAARAFGDGSVFLERFVRRARHVEVQVFGFGDGRAVHFYDRECSVQRRHQKIIEEAIAPALSSAKREEMAGVAVRLAQSCNYTGAGTVEFLYDDDTGDFFFLEMNTRIQVEHPVTEMVTSIDIVGAQIRQAIGHNLTEELAQTVIGVVGHAIEARIYAERPHKRFLPSPGTITKWELPDCEGVRIDTGYAKGMKVTHFYDPMLIKVVAHGEGRPEAIVRLNDALSKLRIEGVETNCNFLRKILSHPDFVAGQVHTSWLNGVMEELL